jgi:hypothetical protein
MACSSRSRAPSEKIFSLNAHGCCGVFLDPQQFLLQPLFDFIVFNNQSGSFQIFADRVIKHFRAGDRFELIISRT